MRASGRSAAVRSQTARPMHALGAPGELDEADEEVRKRRLDVLIMHAPVVVDE